MKRPTSSRLFDFDVDQLAGPCALVALNGLEAQAAKLAHPDSLEDP
jgi:hypothetical protein